MSRTAALTRDEILRYSRHLILPEVTLQGQQRLKAASVLLVGAGGLGAPVSMYLSAAGVGRLGLVDFDDVDGSNLQRQVLFATADVGRPKIEVAQEKLAALNPHVEVQLHRARFSAACALELIEPYDLVIDGTDNFPTRYCVNDACVILQKPNVYGSIFRFEGQATVFDPRRGAATPDEPSKPAGPCYRCLYPEPPPPGMVPSCAEGGVLGVLPGVIGCIQATEAIKLILGQGSSLVGRLLRYNALEMSFRELKLHRDVNCPVCGDRPTIRQLIDYEQFCGMRGEESTTVIRDDSAVPAMTVSQLKAELDGDGELELIDVREPAEHQICHLAGAKLIPLGTLPLRLSEFDPTKRYVVHCKVGGRSAEAVMIMRQAGLNAINVTGGITAWAHEIDPAMPVY